MTAMQTASEILRKHGIHEPAGHDGRRFCTTCPQCSNKRTTAAHKNAKVLQFVRPERDNAHREHAAR